MLFKLGWSFDQHEHESNWCNQIVIHANSSKEASEWYVRHHCEIPAKNNMAILHCKKVGFNKGYVSERFSAKHPNTPKQVNNCNG